MIGNEKRELIKNYQTKSYAFSVQDRKFGTRNQYFGLKIERSGMSEIT
jgi:hypothetical protein